MRSDDGAEKWPAIAEKAYADANVWDNGREDIRIPFDQFKTSFEAVKVNPVYVRDAAP